MHAVSFMHKALIPLADINAKRLAHTGTHALRNRCRPGMRAYCKRMERQAPQKRSYANLACCRLVLLHTQAYALGSCKQKAQLFRQPLAVLVVSISQARRHGQLSRDTRYQRRGGRCAEST